MRARWLAGVLLVVCTVAPAAQQAQPAARPPESPRLRLTSNAFSDGASLPLGFSCYAEDGSRQVAGGRGIVGYRPPCAPAGAGPLHYQFKVYALDRMLTLPSSATRADVMSAMDGHIVGTSTYYAYLE